MQSSVDRASVAKGGAVGLVVGLGLLGIALFFLVTGPDAPSDLLGVFLPLAAGLVSLGLAAMALVPLRYGDTPERSPGLIALVFRLLGGLGVLLTAIGVTRGELPWLAFGIVPLLASVALVYDSFRVTGRATRRSS